MKDVELRLIAELMKNSRRSDRELAKKLGISQPTVSRVRSRLEKEMIREYTIRANLPKLGFKLLAVFFAKLNPGKQLESERLERAKDFVGKRPNIIFASTGQGINSDRLSISLHRDYSDYAKFMREIKAEHGEVYSVTGSFLISLESDKILRPMTMKDLADHLKPEEKSG